MYDPPWLPRLREMVAKGMKKSLPQMYKRPEISINHHTLTFRSAGWDGVVGGLNCYLYARAIRYARRTSGARLGLLVPVQWGSIPHAWLIADGCPVLHLDPMWVANGRAGFEAYVLARGKIHGYVQRRVVVADGDDRPLRVPRSVPAGWDVPTAAAVDLAAALTEAGFSYGCAMTEAVIAHGKVELARRAVLRTAARPDGGLT